MNPVSIGSATSVYETASKCEITRHWVDHSGLADVSHSLRGLIQSLDAEAEQEFWQRTLGPVRRFAFTLCSTPLPFDRAAAAVGIDWDKLQKQVRLCQQQYPDSHPAFTNLVQNLQRLSAETVSPFTAALEAIHSESGGLSLVVRNPRMNQAVASYFSRTPSLRKVKVVSAKQLRGAHLCDVLAVIGPCGWFPEYLFSAPRAKHIHVVSFRWIRDPWKPGPVFLNGSEAQDDNSRKHCVGAMPRIIGQTAAPSQSASDLQPLDLLPPIPAFSKFGLYRAGWQHGGSEELVPARICHLIGGRAVFVAADEGSASLIIDSSEKGESAVRRVPADELETELYLLLRTSGGGDFIAPLADLILGDSASTRRVQQAEWKERLLAAAKQQFGLLSRRELSARVAGSLNSKGLSDSRPANVHYWMSSKCIRPRKEADFSAILSFAGLSSRLQELWEAMREIDGAHRRAGFAIRRMLLHKIATSSLEPLERDGEMVFDLGEQGGGTISAFQITSMSNEEIEVPAENIGVLLDLEE